MAERPQTFIAQSFLLQMAFGRKTDCNFFSGIIVPRCQLQEACSSCHQGDPRLCRAGYGKFERYSTVTPFALQPGDMANVLVIQGTKDVRVDPQLNKKVWEAGIKGVPFRLRVRISRKRNDEENAKERLYSHVQAVNVKDPKGLHTTTVDDA